MPSINEVKASEAIKMLEDQIKLHGDLPLKLWGMYGSSSDEFELLEDNNLRKEDVQKRTHIHIWTGINTG